MSNPNKPATRTFRVTLELEVETTGISQEELREQIAEETADLSFDISLERTATVWANDVTCIQEVK